MKKRVVSLLLCLVMIASMAVVPAQAAYTPQYTAQAETLYELGLFRGTGTNADGSPIYALDKTATRMQGLIMLIRLLGEEEEALNYTGKCPFTDVSGNAAKYAAYAYSKGYTTGTTATIFGNGPLKANAFLTFTLRALGYNDKAGDFSYSTAFIKAAEIGLIASGECTNQSQGIYRDVCAQVSYNALVTDVKDGGTLVDKLIDAGAVDAKKAEASGILKAQPVYGSNRDYKAYDTAHTNMMTAKVKAAVAKDAKYYGLDESISWIAEPKTTEEFFNNVYCCFLVGDYSLYSIAVHDEENAKRFADSLARSIGDLAANNPQLMGAFGNGRIIYGCYNTRDGSYYRANMDLRIENASLSNEEIYRQQNEAMETAYAISKQLHDSGKIKSGMSQKEIAQVYYDYLQKLGVKVGDVGFGAKNPGENMKYDTVYSCLVQKSANCMGRAAAYNVLMHIEGISAQAVQCHSYKAAEGNNHVMTRVVLDGVEYVCDWGNKLPIQSVESASSKYEFFESSLSAARAASEGTIQTENKPSSSTFTISYFVEDAQSKKYAYDSQDILLALPDAYYVSGAVMETNDAQKKFDQADFSLRSLYLYTPPVRLYCSGITDTCAPLFYGMKGHPSLEFGKNTYSAITVTDKDCNLLAYSLVGPNKKNDGKLTFTVCNYSAPEEIEAARAANLAAYQNAVKVDASAFTQTNNVLKADMSKLPEGVKDFKYFARGGKSGNAVTEEQMVRGALYHVECDPLKDTAYSPIRAYGTDTGLGGGNPLKSGSVLLLYDANKVLVGYSLIP